MELNVIYLDMAAQKGHKQPGILYSCYMRKSSEGEQFIPEHVLSYNISGVNEIFVDGRKYVFKEGDFRFFKRNQLARYTKYPPEGGEYCSISITMDQEILKEVSREYNFHANRPYTGHGAVWLKPVTLLKSYVDSLRPHLDNDGKLHDIFVRLKVKEAVLVLLQVAPELKDVLFDFSEPGKIDLEAYMNEHYRFNVDLNRFAYLTGRSLATFKRDFGKIFNISPNRWLQQKRLDYAYYLVKEKGWKPSDVYLEAGFKDFSHFSYAFKKLFGTAPSQIA